jgi:hypothetical protein
VSQVRIQLCELLPLFKRTLRSNADRLLQHDLEFSLEKIKSSFRDKDSTSLFVCSSVRSSSFYA